MNRLTIIGFLLLALLMSCQKKQAEPQEKAQPTYQVQEYKGMKILVGEVTPQNIWDEIPDWKAEYMIYQPDSEVVQRLHAIQQDVDIVCVMGIWCPDSRAGVPSFLKALHEAHNPHLKITIYAVDRKLQDPSKSAEKYGVKRVPTFIVFRDGKEIGRMVEIPETTFEADLLEILQTTR